MDSVKQITKETLIPIGLVITVMLGVFWLGKLSTTVDNNTDKVNYCTEQIQSLPSQAQYDSIIKSMDSLGADVNEVRTDVKSLLKSQ